MYTRYVYSNCNCLERCFFVETIMITECVKVKLVEERHEIMYAKYKRKERKLINSTYSK